MKILIQCIIYQKRTLLKLTENKYLVFFNLIINYCLSTFIILIAYQLLINISICYQDNFGI